MIIKRTDNRGAMDNTTKPEKTIINYSVDEMTKERITEVGKAFDRNQGWVIDQAMEIAYPVLMRKAAVISAIAATE